MNMEPENQSNDSRKLAKKRGPPAVDESDAADQTIDLKRRKFISGQEPSRKLQMKQEKGLNVSGSIGSSSVPNAELEKQANELTLEKLQEFLNSTEEDAIQHGLRVFSKRMLSDAKQATQKKPLLDEYFASSPLFQEFFAIWDFLQHKDRARTFAGAQLLDTLDCVLRCAGIDSQAASVLSRELLKKRLQALVVNLTTEFNAILISTLKLLKSIAAQGPWQAREVFRHLNFGSKSTVRLMDRRQTQSQQQSKKSHSRNQHEQDVRTHFVRLGLGFIKSEDDTLIEEVLGMKGFIGAYFKGMPSDSTQLQREVLETIREHVLRNPAVSKRSKSLFFTASVLDTLCTQLHGLAVASEANDESDYLNILLAFMTDLCASAQYGILYKEPPTYIPPNQHQQAPATHNPRVLSALHLLKPADHPLLAKLALTILTACPALKRLYVDKLKLGLDPRPTLKWLANIRFVQRVIADVPIEVDYYVSYLLHHSSDAWGGSDRVVSWILPNILSRQTLVSSVTHADRAVCYAGLLTCCDIAETCRALLAQLSAKTNSQASLRNDLLHAFRKRLPDLQTLLTCLRKLEQPEQPAKIAAAGGESLGDTSALPLLETAYKLLKFYVELFPEAFVEARFDFGKLMSNFTKDSISITGSALQELILLLRQAVAVLKWNAPVAGAQPGLTQLSALIHLMLSHPSVASGARDLVEKLLVQSGLFDGANPIEIAIWIDCLANSSSLAIKSFESTLTKSSQEPYALAEAISSAAQELSLVSKYLPVSIPFMCALKHSSGIYSEPSSANYLQRVIVAAAELTNALPVIRLVFNQTGSIMHDSDIIYHPFVSDHSDDGSQLKSALETPSVPMLQLHESILNAPITQVDASLHSIARLFAQQSTLGSLPNRLTADLFTLKSVLDALADQKKPSRETQDIMRLLLALPLHVLLNQAFQVVHISVSRNDKLSLKTWNSITELVNQALDSLSAQTDCLRALATVQLHISLLTQALELAEQNGGRVDEAVQGLRFGFSSLEKLTIALVKRGNAAAVVGSLDANSNLLHVFLSPSDVGIRVTEMVVQYFENTAVTLRQASAYGFVPFTEKVLSTLSSDVDVSEGLLRRSASALLQFVPTSAAPVIYSAAVNQSWEAHHWVWNLLVRSLESDSDEESVELPAHLKSFVTRGMKRVKFQPSESICARLMTMLTDASEGLKEAGIERVVLEIMISDLISSSSASNTQTMSSFDAISSSTLLKLLDSGSHSAEVASIISLALLVQSYVYDIEDTVPAAILKSLSQSSLTDNSLPILAAYLRVSSSRSSHQRNAIVQRLSQEMKWLLEAVSRSSLAADILVYLQAASSASAEDIARFFGLWPVVAKAPKVVLTSGALKLLANTVLKSTCDSKLLAIVIKEIYNQGILPARKANDDAAFSQWHSIIQRDSSKLKVLSASDIKSIVRSLLREGIRDEKLLSLSSELFASMKPALRADTLKDLHDLLVSHPLFLDIVFGTTETIGDARGELGAIMNYMYSTCPDSIEVTEQLLRVYLGAYTASLSRFDRAVLSIIHHFEQEGHSVARAGMCWGPHARKALLNQAMQTSAQRDKDAMDVEETNSAETILEHQINAAQALFFDGKLVEAKRVSATLRRFPVRRHLDCRESNDEADTVKYYDVPSASRTPLDQVYDPAFLIPFFSLALRSFEMKDAKRFADIGALSFTLMCLSCEDDELRREAYNVLALYDALLGPMQLAEGAFADFREQPQLRQLMNNIKYAITSPNQRITSIVGSFLAQATFVAVRAEHPMYMNINEFLSSRALLDVETVPMFRQLFFSTSLVDFRRDREWLLRIIAHGLLQQQDLEQLQRRRALGLLELHISSPAVSSDREQGYIWIILQNAMMVDSQHDYTLNESILGWATQLLASAVSTLPAALTLKLLNNVATLLHTICLLPDIEELVKSSLIWVQLQSLAAVLVGTLHSVGSNVLEATRDEDNQTAVNTIMYILHWTVEALARFGLNNRQSMLDASIVHDLLSQLNFVDKRLLTEQSMLKSTRLRLIDLITCCDTYGAAISSHLPSIAKGLVSLAIDSVEDKDATLRFISALKWTLSVSLHPSAAQNAEWPTIASSWRAALALLDQHSAPTHGKFAQVLVTALTDKKSLLPVSVESLIASESAQDAVDLRTVWGTAATTNEDKMNVDESEPQAKTPKKQRTPSKVSQSPASSKKKTPVRTK